jgi:phosphatidylglycerol:prolipoprotein diacylglycerol transferase
MHPVLIRIGDFAIGSYGLAIVLGLFAALWLCSRLGRRCGIAPNFYYDLVFLVMVCGFIGARLFFIGLNWDDFIRAPGAYILSRQGFVYLGGFFVATMAAILFIRHKKLPLLEVGDTAAPAVALSHVFGRIGCFSAGCCYGKVIPADHGAGWIESLVVRFPLVEQPDGSIDQMFNFAYHAQVDMHLIQRGMAPLPVLPVQLFEALGNLIICFLLLWTWGCRKYSGQVFVYYLLFYGVLRFFVEFLRGDADRGLFFNGAISTSQIISLLAIAVGLIMMTAIRNRGIQPVASAGSSTDQLGGQRGDAGESSSIENDSGMHNRKSKRRRKSRGGV